MPAADMFGNTSLKNLPHRVRLRQESECSISHWHCAAATKALLVLAEVLGGREHTFKRDVRKPEEQEF